MGYRFSGGDDYKVSGFFTGCLFHVEGEGISRVQANLTGGALYRVTFEDGPTDPTTRAWASWQAGSPRRAVPASTTAATISSEAPCGTERVS
ncbi:MAG: hypothetical protein ACLSVD_06870 [Eggerthellaceae bacterium]